MRAGLCGGRWQRATRGALDTGRSETGSRNRAETDKRPVTAVSRERSLMELSEHCTVKRDEAWRVLANLFERFVRFPAVTDAVTFFARHFRQPEPQRLEALPQRILL